MTIEKCILLAGHPGVSKLPSYVGLHTLRASACSRCECDNMHAGRNLQTSSKNFLPPSSG